MYVSSTMIKDMTHCETFLTREILWEGGGGGGAFPPTKRCLVCQVEMSNPNTGNNKFLTSISSAGQWPTS